jgi:Flp pilus assembly protein TadG
VRALLARFRRDEDGAVAVVLAVALPSVIGMTSLVIDGSNLRLSQSRLQYAVDSASLGAVQALPDSTTAISRAVSLVAQNLPSHYGRVTTEADVEVGTYDAGTKTFTAGGTQPNAVRVTAQRSAAHGNPIPAYFAWIFGYRSFETQAASAAVVSVTSGGSPRACLYALDVANPGIDARGSVSVNATCGVQLSSYIATSGSAGNYNGQICQSVADNGARGNFNPGRPRACTLQGDPFGLKVDMSGMSCQAFPNSLTSITPGCYTGTIPNKNNYNFQPGNYFFKGAIIDVGGNDALNITGNGVTLAFDTSSTIKTRGSGTLNLNISAPTSGPYQGFSIVGSPSLELHGNSNFNAQGSIYMPASDVHQAGNTDFRADVLIVKTLDLRGNVQIDLRGTQTSRQPQSNVQRVFGLI